MMADLVARHRRRLEPAARHLRLRAAARQRLRERARRGSGSAALDAARPLADQLGDVFSRATSPIWMDSSTTAPVRRDRGGRRRPARARAPHRLARVRALHRAADPEVCRGRTRRLRGDRSRPSRQLVAGVAPRRHARGDRPGRRLGHEPDGPRVASSGRRTPSARRRRASTPSCRRSPNRGRVVGTLSPYWQQRYGLPPPRASSPGRATTRAASSAPASSARASSRSRSARATRSSASCRRRARATTAPGHVFASPTGAYMGMSVFKNGSLARERVRDAYGMDWAAFSAALARTPPATAARRCCRGSIPRLRRSSSSPASGATGSSRPTPMPTSAPSSKRR